MLMHAKNEIGAGEKKSPVGRQEKKKSIKDEKCCGQQSGQECQKGIKAASRGGAEASERVKKQQSSSHQIQKKMIHNDFKILFDQDSSFLQKVLFCSKLSTERFEGAVDNSVSIAVLG